MYRKPIYMKAVARLRNDKFANFLTYYHNQDTKTDVFYNNIKSIIASNICNPDIFKSPINEEGFFFKKDIVKCKKLNNSSCLLEDLYDTDVLLNLKIQPYDFTDKTGKQLNGVSITLLEARQIFIPV